MPALNAIALKPDYFEANYNLGALYVNQAAEILEKANELPLDAVKEYERQYKIWIETNKKYSDMIKRYGIPFPENLTVESIKEWEKLANELDEVKRNFDKAFQQVCKAYSK